MTEKEWMACRNPEDMLHSLRAPSRRKLALFAAACRRLNWARLDDIVRDEVEVQERYAEGRATAEEVVEAREAYGGEGNAPSPEPDTLDWALGQAEEEAEDAAYRAAGNTEDLPNPEEDPWHIAHKAQLAAQCGLLRDIFGPPSRNPLAARPDWPAAVATLARAAYAERDASSGNLDPARLAVLSDALEETGCADAELLAHLRSPGPHVRGCWALDLIVAPGEGGGT